MLHRSALPACVLLFCVAATLGAAENQLTDAEKEAGWKLLFDGKSADGWRGYNKPDVPEKWVIEDGALKGKGVGV